jgi:hypothetical protein
MQAAESTAIQGSLTTASWNETCTCCDYKITAFVCLCALTVGADETFGDDEGEGIYSTSAPYRSKPSFWVIDGGGHEQFHDYCPIRHERR